MIHRKGSSMCLAVMFVCQHIHWLSCVRFVAAWLQQALQAKYLPNVLFKSLQDMHYNSMLVMHYSTVQGCVASH